ncbi:MAG: HDOD domain-containing protein [Myxococcaceae bacterium]|nr:HDOD domain-containing protein [Myxococcaceae bacterium]
MDSFWDWIRRLFGAAPSDTPAPSPSPRKPPPATKASNGAPPGPELTVLPGGLDQKTPFDQLAEWSGLSAPDRSPLTQVELDADQDLATRVVEHFRANRQAPSSLPAVSLQVLNAIASPSLSLADLSRLISQDPALAAGVLKVANSPGYVGVQETQTLRDAVTRLGLSEVGRVAGMVAARSLIQPQVRGEFTAFGTKWNDLFVDSVTAARGAAWLSMRVRKGRSDHVFVAGMLHDLGRSVAMRSIAALSMAGESLDEHRVDRVVEQVHVEVGGEVHQTWGLPKFPTLVALRHHDLDLPADGEFADVHVVRLVSALVQLQRSPWRFAAIRDEVNHSCAALGADAFLLRALVTQLKEEQAHVENAFAEPGRRKVG